MNSRKRKALRGLGKVLFVLYIGFLIYFLIFSDWYGRTTTGMEEYHYNLVLFKEIKRFWEYRHQVGLFAMFTNLFGNVLIFMPFGFFLPFMTGNLNRKNAFVIAAAVPLVIELLQFILGRSFDIDDLICNFLGIIIGFFIAYGIKKVGRSFAKSE